MIQSDGPLLIQFGRYQLILGHTFHDHLLAFLLRWWVGGCSCEDMTTLRYLASTMVSARTNGLDRGALHVLLQAVRVVPAKSVVVDLDTGGVCFEVI